MSLEERIQFGRKEAKRKVLEDFTNDQWIHPTFLRFESKRFKRISNPVQITFEEKGETIFEKLKSDFPRASIVGSINNYLAVKAKRQNQTKLNLKQEKPIEFEKVIQLNMLQFEKYIAVERYSKKDTEVQEEEETKVIGALTDFDILKKEEESRNRNDTSTETAETINPEEIEKRRVEDFRKKKKEELASLQEELDELQGNLSPDSRKIKASQARAVRNPRSSSPVPGRTRATERTERRNHQGAESERRDLQQ